MKTTSILFLFMLLLVFSCDKAQEALEPNENKTFDTASSATKEPTLQITDGLLTFSTIRELKNTLDFVLLMNSQEANDWFLSKGFSNLEMKYNNLFEQIEKLNSDEEIIAFVRNNSQYLFIDTDLTGEKEIMMTTDNFQNYIANESFLVKVGDKTIDIRNNLLIGSNSLRSCSTPQEIYYTKSSHCFRGRRAKLRAFTEVAKFDQYEDDLHLNELKLRGQRKNACIWFNYTNPLDFSISPSPTMTSDYGAYILGPSLYGDDNCEDCWYIAKYQVNVVPKSNSSPNITQIEAKGTSQGIGNNWVELSCQD